MRRSPGSVSFPSFSFPAQSRPTRIRCRSNCVHLTTARSIGIWSFCVNGLIRRPLACPTGADSPSPCAQPVVLFLRRGRPKYRDSLILWQVLVFQRALVFPQFPIQCCTTTFVGGEESLSSSMGLGTALGCALRPLFEASETLLQMCSSFRDLRIFHHNFGEPVIRIQSQREKIILDDIFLDGPAVDVGLSKLNCIDRWWHFGGHNGNQFRRR